MTNNLWPDELKILVVDDEQDILNLIRLSLEPAGFRVLRARHPQEGLDLALRERPDLLLLDIVLPGFNGLELLRRVRRHPKLQQIPAIVLSARAETAGQKRLLKLAEEDDARVDVYLGKPFDPSVLLQTVKDVLVQHKDYLLQKQRTRTKTNPAQRVII
jgi:DNA-binding response OmpR family regulator